VEIEYNPKPKKLENMRGMPYRIMKENQFWKKKEKEQKEERRGRGKDVCSPKPHTLNQGTPP